MFYETEKYDFCLLIIIMTIKKTDIAFKGRYLGITFLVIVQFIVGLIHMFFGAAMLSGIFSVSSYLGTPIIYSVYTLVYGCLTFFFTYLVWTTKRLGWIGTVAVSFFVILADTLTVFNLFNVLGIPKLAAIGEIPFSIVIILYLLQDHVRSKYNV